MTSSSAEPDGQKRQYLVYLRPPYGTWGTQVDASNEEEAIRAALKNSARIRPWIVHSVHRL